MKDIHGELRQYTKEELIYELNDKINCGEIDACKMLFDHMLYVKDNGKTLWNMKILNTKLAILGIAFQIYEQEKRKNVTTIFESTPSWEKIVVHYYRLKFYLRRIEYDLLEEEQEKLVTYAIIHKVSFQQMYYIIQYSIAHKVKVWNGLGMLFFLKGYYDRVIPFLSEAYGLEPENEETLYNLAYVLYHLGEFELAHEYITAIKVRTKTVEILSKQIEMCYRQWENYNG